MNIIFKCPHCGKEFSSKRSLGSHLGHHSKSDNEIGSIKDSNINSLHIRDESGKIIEYVCKCGKRFTNKQSYCSHCSHCSIKRGKDVERRGSNINDWWSKLKVTNLDKFTYLHRKAGILSVKKQISLYGENNLSRFSRISSDKRDEARRKQSYTRKMKYLSGDLNPPKSNTKYFSSYFNNMYIRSSYELIYVSYLYLNSFGYKYESIRIRYKEKVYISDFELEDGTLVEVKGYEKFIPIIKDAFESNGYNIRFIGPRDILKIKLYLRNIIDIDSLLYVLELANKSNKNLYWTIDKSSRNILYKIVSKGDNESEYKYNIIANKQLEV